MEITIKQEVQDATFKYSDDLGALNEALKEEPEELCSDNLSDVGSIKIEEHDIEDGVPESFKIEKDEQNHESSLERDAVYYCYNCDFKCFEKSSFIVHAQTHNKKSTNRITSKSACYSKFLPKSNLKKQEAVQVATFKYSDDLGALNEATKEELCSDNLSDVGSIKIEEHDIEDAVSKSFKIEKEEQNHESSLERDAVYYCYNCDFNCFEKSSLIAHVQTHNKKSTNRIASKSACHSKFLPKSNLKKQEAVQVATINHSDDLDALNEVIKEELCSDNLSDVGLIEIEEHDIEESIPVFTIEKEEQNLESSLERDVVYYCYNCDFKCSDKPSLIVHMQIHKKKPPNSIMIKLSCKSARHYKFLLESNLKKHRKPPFRCSECDYKCLWKSALKKHLLRHIGEKPFKCYLCAYESLWRNALKSHLLVHAGEKRFKCSICDYKSTRRSTLKSHSFVHTDEKPFKCTVCDYKGSRKNDLKSHSLMHLDEKPFKCSVCGSQFPLQSRLKQHLLVVHTDEKPFKCGICNYEFSLKGGLKKHILVHTGKKPFKCSVCDYTCIDKKSLNRHLSVHTGDKP